MTKHSVLQISAATVLVIVVGYLVVSLIGEQPLSAQQPKNGIVELKTVRFVDDQGATSATLSVREARIAGKLTPQLVLLDAKGNEVWAAPQEVRTIPLGK